jgi:hypothetical protein
MKKGSKEGIREGKKLLLVCADKKQKVEIIYIRQCK